MKSSAARHFSFAHDLIRPCFARRSSFRRRSGCFGGVGSGLRARVRPLAGPSTGSSGKPVPIPDQAEDRLFGIMRLGDKFPFFFIALTFPRQNSRLKLGLTRSIGAGGATMLGSLHEEGMLTRGLRR